MHAASVDPEPGSNSPNVLRRVATATSIRGFDRSHILVQMFPVTLQLLRCSVGRDSAWRRPGMMGPAPHGVKRTDQGFDRLGGPFAPASQEVARRRILRGPLGAVKRCRTARAGPFRRAG